MSDLKYYIIDGEVFLKVSEFSEFLLKTATNMYIEALAIALQKAEANFKKENGNKS